MAQLEDLPAQHGAGRLPQAAMSAPATIEGLAREAAMTGCSCSDPDCRFCTAHAVTVAAAIRTAGEPLAAALERLIEAKRNDEELIDQEFGTDKFEESDGLTAARAALEQWRR